MTAGGWTEIMRRDTRIKEQVNFKHTLAKYAAGFGNLNSNHFLGKFTWGITLTLSLAYGTSRDIYNLNTFSS